MSDEKNKTQETKQQVQAQPADALDAQYKSIGISAVSAAASLAKNQKAKKPGPQWS